MIATNALYAQVNIKGQHLSKLLRSSPSRPTIVGIAKIVVSDYFDRVAVDRRREDC